jgi:serine phosphatase RsbU (regulator of sigma subunit)
LERGSRSDVFAVYTDDSLRTTVVVADLAHPSPETHGISGEVLSAARRAVQSGSGMRGITEAITRALPQDSGVRAALGIVSLLPEQGRVEVLNAGLPPIVCARPDGTASLFAARSAPLGLVQDEPHAYELVPFSWSDTWAILTDGATEGSLAGGPVKRLGQELGLAQQGLELASLPPGELLRRLGRVLARAGCTVVEDATLIVAAADPGSHASMSMRYEKASY